VRVSLPPCHSHAATVAASSSPTQKATLRVAAQSVV